MIDIEYAKRTFASYLSNYDEMDDKIKLKKIHTFSVLQVTDEICQKEKLEEV